MSKLSNLKLIGIGLLAVLAIIAGFFGGAGDAAQAIWKFKQDYPHASALVLLDINQQEAKVPSYELPPVMLSTTGKPLTTAEQWQGSRDDLLKQFSDHIYGVTPDTTVPVKPRVLESSLVLGEKVLRQQVELDFGGHKVTVLIYRPNDIVESVPAFLGLNFRGNHTVSESPDILLATSWVPKDLDNGVLTHQATDANRGQRIKRYPVEMITNRGYALVTAYYGDFYNDHIGGQATSIQNLFERDTNVAEWGAIGTWSWGMSRILDYLEQEESIDATQVVSIGHSRLGKAALWAAAQDERFAAAIGNNSGAVGAALSRRQFGETVGIITELFPHWFTPKFRSYSKQEDTLPVDQHQLVALVAPRPVYVASASEDLWADPYGEFLSARAAQEVYSLYGLSSSNLSTMPAAGEAVYGPVSYHLRAGKHDLLSFDWEHYLAFADCYVVKGVACR